MSRPSTFELLDDSYRAVNRLVAAHLARSRHPGVRASHGAVFENIHRDGSRITDMADRAGITKQSMSQFVRELEAAGYVARGPDPADGRARLVRLTAAGQDAVRTARRVLAELETRLTAALGAHRLEELRGLLDEVNRIVADDTA